MLEGYPLIDNGEMVGSLRIISDILEVTKGNVSEYYVFLLERAALAPESISASIRSWIEPGLGIHGYFIREVDEYVDLIIKNVKEHIKNKKVLLNFSGGKDSLASLIILKKMQEIVDFDLKCVYVHIPVLEPCSNIDFVEKVAKMTNTDIKTVEADKKRIVFYLERNGLPRIGNRWCTYMKILALRNFRKKYRADIKVRGDRILEGGKRYSRMLQYLKHKSFIQGTRLNVVYPLTLLDIVKIVRESGLVHPNYYMGMTRVACKYCPYKSLYEFSISDSLKVENEEYIENIAVREYQKYYSTLFSWKDFWSNHLWRFSPSRAQIVLQIKIKSKESIKIISFKEIKKIITSIWKTNFKNGEYLSFDTFVNLLEKILERSRSKGDWGNAASLNLP